MRKQDFLSALKTSLLGLPKQDVEEHLNFYSEMIDDRMEEGRTEEEAVADIGSVEEIATQIPNQVYYIHGKCRILQINFFGTKRAAASDDPFRFTVYLNLAFIVGGIGWATINVNSFPMVVEIAKGGNVGKYTGYYYTASMAAQIVTPILSGWIMELFGNMSPLFYYSTFFIGAAFITMMFVKHGDAKKEGELNSTK